MIAEKEIKIWAKALLKIMEKNDIKKSEAAADNLAEILRKKKKGYLLPKIIKRASALYSKRHGIKIFLAKDHPNDFVEKFTAKVLSHLKSLPEEVEVCTDPDLIGGFQVRAGNFLMKASIKDFLNELKANIK